MSKGEIRGSLDEIIRASLEADEEEVDRISSNLARKSIYWIRETARKGGTQ